MWYASQESIKKTYIYIIFFPIWICLFTCDTLIVREQTTSPEYFSVGSKNEKYAPENNSNAWTNVQGGATLESKILGSDAHWALTSQDQDLYCSYLKCMYTSTQSKIGWVKNISSPCISHTEKNQI